MGVSEGAELHELVFGSERGGIVHVSGLEELRRFCRNQFELWSTWETDRLRIAIADLPEKSEIRQKYRSIAECWQSNGPQIVRQADEAGPLGHFAALASNNRALIMFDSPAGIALRIVERDHSSLAFLKVLGKYLSGVTEVNEVNSRAYEDFLYLLNSGKYADIYRSHYASRAELENAKKEVVKSLEVLDSLRSNISSSFDRISILSSDLEDLKKQTVSQIFNLSQNYADLESDRNNKFRELLEGYDKEYEQIKLAASEKIKINSSALLWRGRYRHYSFSSKKNRNLLLACGISGLIILCIWWVISFWFSKIFYSGFSFEQVKTDLSIIRGRLVITSFLVVLYLTMYLWMMRLLVRNYVSSEHLRVDALSRSSMASTYLALVKDGAIDDGDRSIVLASLFRPVMDGLVKDEGPPALSLSALLSNAVQGKNS